MNAQEFSDVLRHFLVVLLQADLMIMILAGLGWSLVWLHGRPRRQQTRAAAMAAIKNPALAKAVDELIAASTPDIGPEIVRFMREYHRVRSELKELIVSLLRLDAIAKGHPDTADLDAMLEGSAEIDLATFERVATAHHHRSAFWSGVWQSFVGSLLSYPR